MSWLLQPLVFLALHPFRTQGVQGALPLEVGRTWEYRGSVRWSGSEQRVDSAAISWTMQIVATQDGPEVHGALVRGWIQELAWYQPGQTPGYSVLWGRSGRLYHVATPDSANAALTLRQAVEPGATAPTGSELIVDSALVVGHLYGQIEERGDRTDTFYAWYVESMTAISPLPGWSLAGPTVLQWHVVYRTAPDHQILEVVPGLGITHYVFGHHGTVADADIQLVTVTRAP